MLSSKSIDLVQRRTGFEPGAFAALRIAINGAILAQDFEKAKSLCDSALSENLQNESILAELAQLYLILGEIDAAIQCLQSIQKIKPDSHDIAMRIAELLRLHIDAEASMAYLRSQIAEFPQHPPYYEELASLYHESGDTDALNALIRLAKGNDIAIPERYLISISETPHVPLPQEESYSQELSDADIRVFMELFAGRENCHARQWVSDIGKSGYSPVPEPLSQNHIRSHLAGNYTLGIYQLTLKSQVNWIAFDLDVDKSHLDDLHDSGFRLWMEEGFQSVIKSFESILSAYHIPFYVENSGFKGYHIWIFMQQSIGAAMAMSFAQRIAAQVSISGYPINLEIFPKQKQVSAQNYGNLIKLPYGIHRLSGNTSTMVDSCFMPIAPISFVRSVLRVDANSFISALMSLDPGFSIKNLPDLDNAVSEPHDQISEASTPIPDCEEDVEWMWLKQHCHALQVVDTIIHTKRQLDAEPKKVLKYTCGFLKQGPAIVNKLLKKCTNTDPADLMQSGFKGNCISCEKIRTYMAGMIDFQKCNCDFESQSGSYPSPLLHLASLKQIDTGSKGVNDLKIKSQVAAYLELRQKAKEMSSRLTIVERQLLDIFDDIGVDSIETDLGILKRIDEEGKIRLSLELL